MSTSLLRSLFLICFLLNVSAAGKKNFQNPQVCIDILPDPSIKSVGVKKWKWRNGQQIRVSYIGGSPTIRAKIQQYAVEWSLYANLQLVFLQSGSGDVRIGFTNNGLSYSLIGTQSQNNSVNPNTQETYLSSTGPTMNFGWFNETTPDEEFKRTTLHEFGHAIGLEHEHQHPLNTIPWKKEVVYAYYQQFGWSRAKVDGNIFNRILPLPSYAEFSVYDRQSIMHYPIPASHVTDPSYSVGWNIELSYIDKNFISVMYPFSCIRPNAVSIEDQYLVGNWVGRNAPIRHPWDHVAVRRLNYILKDNNFDSYYDFCQEYGFGNKEDQYLVGDWDGNGTDNIGVRRGNNLFLDFNNDGIANMVYSFGNGNAEDEYLVGDWNGDGTDNIAVRRGNKIFMDFDFKPGGIAEFIYDYGSGNAEDEYLVGDWNGDDRDNIGIRRGNTLFLDFDYKKGGIAELIFSYGFGNTEDQYLTGDWDGDGTDNIAVRRGNTIFMDYDFKPGGIAEKTQTFGYGTKPRTR